MDAHDPAAVLELYSQLTETFAERADPIPHGSWPARFHFVLAKSLETLEPHRDTLAAVLPVLLADREAGLLSHAAIGPRDRVRERFVAAVAASDHPPSDAEALGRLLYLLQLGVLMWWVLDRSEGQHATHELVDLLGEWGGTMSMALWLPGAAGVIRKLDDIATRALFAL
ncbi:MAG: hypothetical protein R3F61_34815 [Myxococcota bacterium]